MPNMSRRPKPSELDLNQVNGAANGIQPGPNSSPMNLQGVDLGSFEGGFEHNLAGGLTHLPKDKSQLPQSPPGSPREHNREASTFLSNFKSKSKDKGKISPERERMEDTKQAKNDKEDYRPSTSSMSKIYHLRKNPGSTPELSLVGSNDNLQRTSVEGEKRPLPARPQHTPQHSEESTTRQRGNKFSLPRVKRATSVVRRDSNNKLQRPTNGLQKDSFDQIPQTAPLESDWPGAESRMNNKGKERDRRGASAERHGYSESEEHLPMARSLPKDNKSSLSRFGKGMKKAGGLLANTIGVKRQNSNPSKDIPDSEYVLKVINLPLVEQTRATRISKDLGSCRDKTEYWMPALPWRCIDYLNTNCEEEGLYRIPGSGPHVKHWQRRFDTELDIDLLSEDIGDTNEIASMLKAWFRELPSELMDSRIQKQLADGLEKQNPNYRNVGQDAPQLLRDTLSELPPFNYYLLFAITCHLSLLLTNKDRNKMDLNNLAVCVGPCLNLERWLFNYLVGDWRHCWQGCFTEKEYLNIEKMVEEGHDPATLPEKKFGDEHSLSNSLWTSTTEDGKSVDDRGLSSGSSKNTSNNDPQSVSRPNLHDGQQSYLPSGTKGQPNGTSGLGIEPELQRPSTAQGFGSSELSNLNTNVPPTSNKDRSNSNTPRVGGHSRSRSDLPPTPVKTNVDYTIPVRPSSRPPSRSSMRRA